MDEEDFQSLSKGVFVIPFRSASSEAGPSRPRPLDQLYKSTLDHYEQAYSVYAAERTTEQLDGISDWLDRCSAPPLLKLQNPIYRLEVGILHNADTNTSSSLSPLLYVTGATTCILNGKDASDVGSAMKSMAIGFIGDTRVAGMKTGRTGIEEVELWYQSQKKKSPLLLHIQEAQLVPSSVLGELMYILSLHPDLPIRLLLSVPSITHFLSSWTPIEISSIALTILSPSNKRRNTGIGSILNASESAPMKISDDLADEIRSEEHKTGGGARLALKTIKWLLLHHSMNSPLSRLALSTDPIKLQKLRSLLDIVLENPDDRTLPGGELFQLTSNKDLSSALNPAPRTSILHALSSSGDFIRSSMVHDQAENGNTARDPSPTPQNASRPKRKSLPSDEAQIMQNSKRKRSEDNAEAENGDDHEVKTRGEELKELQMLFDLWRGAGRSVNLWDWLEGFSGAMADDPQEQESSGKPDNDGMAINGVASERTGEANDHGEEKDKNVDEENEARLHAVFIRFVEEARMIGLIRARGKGRRADEVVKGVALV
ncbi:uncharacterized protein IL334_003414 [Kwoniella shivajii]|uniref:Origin recognition complex subunit 3 winged helix C-terminal domain-containing protein n=1 Tax=Kwoniella shivajii TaxID=564305 RepID=A0ABZ1CZ51_9TREE|nr:hypothetical protein IL334_003414 [Kwoniella shivajii]